MAAFGSIEEGGGEGSNCWYRVTISEGRNREVRRMFESVGHAVSRLIRIRYGAMVLPRGLQRGAWMELDAQDIDALMRAAGAQWNPPAVGREGAQRRGKTGQGGGRTAPVRESKRPAGPKAQGRSAAGGAGQPDPLKTSIGYIGSDSLQRQRKAQRRAGPGVGGRRGGR
jgi:23S rRNA pseudouridine2605 synthase